MQTLRIHSARAPVDTLGPGPAVGLWVQGCPIGCAGCMSRSTWRVDGGAVASVDSVAEWALRSGLDRLVLSGGEPMEQGPALAALVDRLRADREWLVTGYSGYSMERLACDDPPGSATLLAQLDILIDGPYRPDEHAPLLWRGSRNQRIHVLTSRAPALPPDRPGGLSAVFEPDGSFELIGVPPEAQLLRRLQDGFDTAGVTVRVGSPRKLPFPTMTGHTSSTGDLEESN